MAEITNDDDDVRENHSILDDLTVLQTEDEIDLDASVQQLHEGDGGDKEDVFGSGSQNIHMGSQLTEAELLSALITEGTVIQTSLGIYVNTENNIVAFNDINNVSIDVNGYTRNELIENGFTSEQIDYAIDRASLIFDTREMHGDDVFKKVAEEEQQRAEDSGFSTINDVNQSVDEVPNDPLANTDVMPEIDFDAILNSVLNPDLGFPIDNGTNGGGGDDAVEPVTEMSREISYEIISNTVIDDPCVVTTYEDVVSKENDLANNQEIVTTTRNYTDTTTIDSTVTETTTPTETITYSDGTIETIVGDPVIESNTTVDTTVAIRDAIFATDIELPVITTEYTTEISNEIGNEILIGSETGTEIDRIIDTDNNREQVDTTTTTTNNYAIDTTTTTTITPVITITYSDGTVEIEQGDPSITKNTNTETRTDIADEIVTTYEEPTIVVTYEISTDLHNGKETLTNTEFYDSSSRVNDLDNNQEIVTVTREYTDTFETPILETTTTIEVQTITYSDGTIEIERAEPTDNTVQIDTSTRDEIREIDISTSTEEPVITITTDVQSVDTIGDEYQTGTASEENVVTTIETEYNNERVDTTTTTTDTYAVDTTTTTTSTPVHTITYSDGTVETEYGTPAIETTTDTSTRDEVTSETITTNEDPEIVETYEHETTVVVSDEILSNTETESETVRTIDTDNNREQLDTTNTTTNTYDTITTTTVTTTPVITITYSDGTVEIEYGTPVETVEPTTDTREEVLTDTNVVYEEPQIVTSEEVTTNVVVGDETLISTSTEDDVSRSNDLDNNREQLDTTTTTTNNYETDTTTTTTTTQITTITYSDGTVEIEQDDPVITADTTTESRVDTTDEIVTTYEEPTITTEYVTTTDAVVGDETWETTNDIIESDTTIDTDNNREQIDTTTTTTNEYATETTTTTTITPVSTITYSDGTVEVENGTPNIDSEITSDTRTETLTNVETEYVDPEIVTTIETEENIITSEPESTITFVNNESIVENDDGTKTTVINRVFTETTTTDITTETSNTSVNTLTYSDGTVEIERDTPVTASVVSVDTQSSTWLVDETGNTTPLGVDDEFDIDDDNSITFSSEDLLSNDTDLDGDTITITSIDDPENGIIIDNENGTWTYTPYEGFSGEDSFTYNIVDSEGGTGTATTIIDVEGNEGGEGGEGGSHGHGHGGEGGEGGKGKDKKDKDGGEGGEGGEGGSEYNEIDGKDKGKKADDTFDSDDATDANDHVMGNGGDDMFIFGGEGGDGFGGGDWISGGEGTDTLNMEGTQGWALTVDGETFTADSNPNNLPTSEEMSGSLTLSDGSEIDFDGIDKFSWD